MRMDFYCKTYKWIRMAHKLYRVSAPGSLMLLGEHAVLVGKPALVCAVNKRLQVTLVPIATDKINLSDARLGAITLSISQLQVTAPFKFVTRAIMLFSDRLPHGFNLTFNAEFASTIGLGSSAAVTVATIAVLHWWIYGEQLQADKLLALAKQVVTDVQGVGSGADLAASIYGGVLSYNMQPVKCTTLPVIPNLTAVYCGYKTPTPQVINIVHAAAQQQPQLYASIFDKMHACVTRAITAMQQADWATLGAIFLQHHALQSELGVSDSLLNDLVNTMAAQTEIYGAKISGAGLGDCVIGLGELSHQIFTEYTNVLQFPVAIDQQGLLYVDY